MRADIALIGFGNVARRFARLLGERAGDLRTVHDLDARIVAIATGRHGSAFAARGLDVETALQSYEAGRLPASASSTQLIGQLAASDARMRVVIETTPLTIADGQPAIAHIEAAIDAGCDAITANKGPVAFAYRRLRDRAAAAGRSFLFEGVVMDGVPVFNLARETMPALTFHGFRGIVNSTTNHILTALERGEPFGPALTRMQSEGIAEADPSLDVEGWDAAAKTAALANVLMGANLTPREIDRTGIGPETGPLARQARAAGRRLRLVASASRTPDGFVSGRVRPEELDADDILAHVSGKANALVLRTDLLGEVAVHQLGGDVTMTAYALLSDLITLRRRESTAASSR